jgi:hypothetical protein
MKKYTEPINELISQVESKMPAQITIDFFQDFQMEFLIDREEPIERDQIGAKAYDISVLLDVFDPKFEYDIAVFKKMYKILDEWAEDIDFRNRALGIPAHKG